MTLLIIIGFVAGFGFLLLVLAGAWGCFQQARKEFSGMFGDGFWGVANIGMGLMLLALGLGLIAGGIDFILHGF